MRFTDLRFRPIEEADLSFLRSLYASTRTREMARTGWSQPAIDAFLSQQFDAQHRHYQEHYQGADFSIVLNGEHPIGRLYILRGASTYNLMDLSLLPAWRGLGIGRHLLSLLIEEAEAADKSIRLYVEPDNPARRLYERFDFVITRQDPVYLEMHRLATRRLSA
ncbi:GNAT family N-acetyltransferase [Pseudomonas mendocina]|nr:N-acetyltransferase [Pseudomonas mendocina]MBH3339816.1 GNAT family N-acetyltransferase [Pseudomonas mendocina]